MTEQYVAVDITVFAFLVFGCAVGVLGGAWALFLLLARLLGLKVTTDPTAKRGVDE